VPGHDGFTAAVRVSCTDLFVMRRVDSAEVVKTLCARRPLAVGVLRAHRIDPSSSLTVGACCDERGLSIAMVFSELRAREDTLASAWRGRTIAELVDHVVLAFHRPLAAKLGELTAMIEAAQPIADPALGAWRELGAQLVELQGELELHLIKEEQVLFPWLRSRAATAASPIRAMQLEHADAIGLLLAMHDSADRWQRAVSDSAVRATIAKLDEIERWLCEHIHFESNELFPRALDEG
jgi:regulator of cell morphogenesis and NO signaling